MARGDMGEAAGASGREAQEAAIGAADADAVSTAGGRRALDDRPGPTWGGWVISILVAVILSAAATLLLGGSLSRYTQRPEAAVSGSGCAPGAPCCPPAER